MFVFFPIINFKYLDKRSSKQCDWNTDYKFSCSRVCPSWRRCRRWPGAESLSVTVSSRRRRWEPSCAAGQTPRWGWTSVCVRGYSLPGAGRCWSPVCVWVSRCWRSPETRCSMTARKVIWSSCGDVEFVDGCQVLEQSIAVGALGLHWGQKGCVWHHLHEVHITDQINIAGLRNDFCISILFRAYALWLNSTWLDCIAFQEVAGCPGRVDHQTQFRNPLRSVKLDPIGSSPWPQSCCFNMPLNSTPSVSSLMPPDLFH